MMYPMISGMDAFGKSMRDQCVAVAPKFGINIAHEETYGPRDSDMTPQLTNIANKTDVRAVVNTGFGQGPAIVTRNYRQLGITLPLYQSHGVASKQFIDLAGPVSLHSVEPVVVPPTIATILSSSTRRVANVRALLASPPSS